MYVKRSTIEILLLVMFFSLITGVYMIFKEDDTNNYLLAQEMEEQYEAPEAYYYTLKDIQFDGTYVYGNWKNLNNEEQYIATRLPSSGNGMIRNGVSITLRSYEVPEDGILEGCFYWSN